MRKEVQTERVLPYCAALLLEALLFHRHVLFSAGYLFPWDFRAVHLPLATLLADSFRRGVFPLWDPFTYCGMPIFANMQAAVFYPPVATVALFGAWIGNDALPRLMAVSVVGQIALAGLWTFWLLRRLSVRSSGAWIGATVYELGDFFASQAEHMGAIQGAVWLPLIWLCAWELRNGMRRKWLAALSAALALTVLAGLPQVAVATFATAILLALALAAFRVSTWRLPMIVSLACIWALVLAAVQFLPTAELTRNSVAKYRVEWLGTGGGIPPGALFSLAIPNYWNVFDLAKFHGPTDPTFLYLYSSILGLLLAMAVMVWKPGVLARVFTVMLLVSTLTMFGDKTVPGRAALMALPDWIRMGIHPEFFLCAFSLALAILVGLGADRFLPSVRLQWAAGAMVACDLILVSSSRPMNEVSAKVEPGFTHDSIEGSTKLVTKLRALTSQTVPPSRIDMRPDVSYLWSSSAPIVGIPTANGCDPLAPERTIEVRRAFAPGPRWGTCFQVVDAGSPVIGLMNTRVLVSRSALDALGMRWAGDVAGYRIYENVQALPRFFFAAGIHTVSSLQEAGAMVRAPGFDPDAIVVVEAPGEPSETLPRADTVVKAVSYTPELVRLETTAAAPAFLVATDSYYPGWQARIDGHSTRLYAADAAFRGIRIPAGHHTVEMQFVPVTLYRSAWISLLAVLMTAIAARTRRTGPARPGASR